MADIFVFGSNRAGRHGRGAALFARYNHGAIYGRGEGIQGNSYAIPTKGFHMEILGLDEIANHVTTFLEFALSHPEMTFNVTAIGCGLAGYHPVNIAPMFDLPCPKNVKLPDVFRYIIEPMEDLF